MIEPIKVHVDNKGIVDVLCRGEMKCICRNAGDADLWIKIWEELHRLTSREILIDVVHVEAHRTEKDKKEMTQFEKFVAEGNEKADELAKEGAMLDEGFYGGSKIRDYAAGAGRGARSPAVCSQLSLSGGGMERL